MNIRNHFVIISTWLSFAGVILAGFGDFAAGEEAKRLLQCLQSLLRLI